MRAATTPRLSMVLTMGPAVLLLTQGALGQAESQPPPGGGAGALARARARVAGTALVDPLEQLAYLKASNCEWGDLFGWSVAACGDTLVVGSRGEDSAATGVNGEQHDNNGYASGAAYVFVAKAGAGHSRPTSSRPNRARADSDPPSRSRETRSSWARCPRQHTSTSGAMPSGTHQACLGEAAAERADGFGRAVGVSADTIVIGAPHDGSSATGVDGNPMAGGAPDSGAAYVFVRTGSAWVQEAYLKASNTGASDLFGTSVAVSG